jgi:hypothetical protein
MARRGVLPGPRDGGDHGEQLCGTAGRAMRWRPMSRPGSVPTWPGSSPLTTSVSTSACSGRSACRHRNRATAARWAARARVRAAVVRAMPVALACQLEIVRTQSESLCDLADRLAGIGQLVEPLTTLQHVVFGAAKFPRSALRSPRLEGACRWTQAVHGCRAFAGALDLPCYRYRLRRHASARSRQHRALAAGPMPPCSTTRRSSRVTPPGGGRAAPGPARRTGRPPCGPDASGDRSAAAR